MVERGGIAMKNGGIEVLDQAIESLGLEHISNDIYTIFNNLKAQGYDVKTKIAGAIYIACQKNGIPITVKKIANQLGVRQKHVFRLLKKKGLFRSNFKPVEIVLGDLLDFVRQKLPISQEEFKRLKHSAEAWLDRIIKHGVMGKPLTLVCTAIYLAGLEQGLDKKYGLVQKWFEQNVGVTDYSIRNAITILFGARQSEEIGTLVRKQRILELLKDGEKTLSELTKEIGLTSSEIRRIVYKLVEEGKADVRIEKGRLIVKLNE